MESKCAQCCVSLYSKDIPYVRERESLKRQGKTNTCRSTNTRLDTRLDIQIGVRKRQGKMEREQGKRIK